MGWINFIVFPIITIIGFYYLFIEKIYIVKDGLIKNEVFPVTNLEFLFLFILGTSIISCGQFMATRLLMSIILVILGILLSRKSIPFSLVILFYGLYLLWLIISIIFISPVKDYGFRVLLKYLYPFLIMMFAAQLTNSIKIYFKQIQVILFMALYGVLLFLILGRIPFIENILWSFTFWGPGILDFFPIAITICLVFYSYFKKVKYFIYSLLFIIPSIINTNRTGILAASITIAVFAIVRYKLKSFPYIFISLGIFIGTLLYIPEFRDKMFTTQMSSEELIERRDELTSDDIDSSGRFAMWEWSLKNFFEGKELKGSGLGQLQYAFYNWDHPFGNLRVVHNDYVQILCDTGLVGLVLYIVTLLSLIIHSLYNYFISKNKIIKLSALIAGVSLMGMVSTLYTDNVVNYSLITLSYPFALYGMMIGLKRVLG